MHFQHGLQTFRQQAVDKLVDNCAGECPRVQTTELATLPLGIRILKLPHARPMRASVRFAIGWGRAFKNPQWKSLASAQDVPKGEQARPQLQPWG